MCYKLVSYWIPRYKYEVIDWLVRHRGYEARELRRRSKSQVYAIYHKIRQR